MKRLLFLGVFLVFFSFALTACNSQDIESNTTGSGVFVGDNLLDFTLNDLNGESVSVLTYSKGKPLLLTFTTTWCSHCITIIPALKEIYSKNKDKGLELLAVYVNEKPENVESFSKKHNIPYKILIDANGKIATSYKIRGVPTLMIIDDSGTIKYRGHGLPEDIIELVINE